MFVFLINSNQHYIHSSYVYGAPVEWCSVLVPLAAAPTCCAAVVARVRPTLPPCAFSRSHGRPSRPSRRIRSPASGPRLPLLGRPLLHRVSHRRLLRLLAGGGHGLLRAGLGGRSGVLDLGFDRRHARDDFLGGFWSVEFDLALR